MPPLESKPTGPYWRHSPFRARRRRSVARLRARNDTAQRTNLMLTNETDPEAVSDLVRAIKGS
jgi:hypothetical protein